MRTSLDIIRNHHTTRMLPVLLIAMASVVPFRTPAPATSLTTTESTVVLQSGGEPFLKTIKGDWKCETKESIQ